MSDSKFHHSFGEWEAARKADPTSLPVNTQSHNQPEAQAPGQFCKTGTAYQRLRVNY